MDRVQGALLLGGAPADLSINGDHPGGSPAQGGGPGHKTVLEPLCIERGEDLAKTVICRGFIEKRSDAAQQSELLFAKLGDVGESLSPGQHRQQGQQQHLIERLDHLT